MPLTKEVRGILMGTLQDFRETLKREGAATNVASVERWFEDNHIVDRLAKLCSPPDIPRTGEPIDITPLQADIATWAHRNFPSESAWTCLLGVVEEIGELSHIELKHHMGIRYEDDEVNEKVLDAVGDITIFLMSYCTHRNICFTQAVLDVWEQVRKRDWRKYPKTGKPIGG